MFFITRLESLYIQVVSLPRLLWVCVVRLLQVFIFVLLMQRVLYTHVFANTPKYSIWKFCNVFYTTQASRLRLRTWRVPFKFRDLLLEQLWLTLLVCYCDFSTWKFVFYFGMFFHFFQPRSAWRTFAWLLKPLRYQWIHMDFRLEVRCVFAIKAL